MAMQKKMLSDHHSSDVPLEWGPKVRVLAMMHLENTRILLIFLNDYTANLCLCHE